MALLALLPLDNFSVFDGYYVTDNWGQKALMICNRVCKFS